MNIGRVFAHAPFIEIFSVFIEDLDSFVAAVVDEDSPRLRIDSDAVHIAHITGPLIRGRSFPAPIEEKFAVLVEFRDARSVVAVGDKESAVRKPGQKGRTVEMRAVRAGHSGRADRLNQLLAIVRELVNGLHMIVYDPDMFLRVIRIDGDEVRALQNLVPLGPAFDDVAVGVGDGDAVFPFGVDAEGA